MIRRTVLAVVGGLVTMTIRADAGAQSRREGPFTQDMASLRQYRCPEWFRDAKLGIWAHWGPQAVPMNGDWYARGMYEEGSRHNRYHLEHYGHPSKFGYKDIIPLWQAEKWDPDRLMALYKGAGARYFVSMACHHDNFDLWNSKYHRWNAVNMGPKRDVVGDWQRAARKLGLKFGVSEHMGASFTWFQVSRRADKSGPMAGAPYDGADPRYEELYHFPAEPGDTGWYSSNPRWQKEWLARVTDLVDQYRPDLLYTDGGVPFGNEIGRGLIAHYYNSDPNRSGARPQVVYTCKQASEGRWIEDLERGVMSGVNPSPWQTDTSIGDWYYNRDWRFRTIDWVIHMLVDIVSKNGNLLLNVVQRPDGSLDPEVEQLLQRMTEWISVHGEGIYGTRPWVTFGEGRSRARGGNFGEDTPYSAADIRFTFKRGTLYAFAMGWPEDSRLHIRSLGTGNGRGVVGNVVLLGYRGKLEWRQNADELTVALPQRRTSSVALALKITGSRLRDFEPPAPDTPAIAANAEGVFLVPVDQAVLHGGLRPERQGGKDNLGFWDSPSHWAEWKLDVRAPGRYSVSFASSTPHAGSRIKVQLGRRTLDVPIPTTGSWQDFRDVRAGELRVDKAAATTLALRPGDAATWKAVNVADIVVRRMP